MNRVAPEPANVSSSPIRQAPDLSSSCNVVPPLPELPPHLRSKEVYEEQSPSTSSLEAAPPAEGKSTPAQHAPGVESEEALEKETKAAQNASLSVRGLPDSLQQLSEKGASVQLRPQGSGIFAAGSIVAGRSNLCEPDNRGVAKAIAAQRLPWSKQFALVAIVCLGLVNVGTVTWSFYDRPKPDELYNAKASPRYWGYPRLQYVVITAELVAVWLCMLACFPAAYYDVRMVGRPAVYLTRSLRYLGVNALWGLALLSPKTAFQMPALFLSYAVAARTQYYTNDGTSGMPRVYGHRLLFFIIVFCLLLLVVTYFILILGVALAALLVKVHTLSFISTIVLSEWDVREFVRFFQFVVNISSLMGASSPWEALAYTIAGVDSMNKLRFELYKLVMSAEGWWKGCVAVYALEDRQVLIITREQDPQIIY